MHMPCFCAKRKYAYKSRVFDRVKVLAHNLIHKRCAEHRRLPALHGTIFEEANFDPKQLGACFLRSKKFSLQIKALSYSQIACAQSYPQKMCRTSQTFPHGQNGTKSPTLCQIEHGFPLPTHIL
jgi:hypothetical protein